MPQIQHHVVFQIFSAKEISLLLFHSFTGMFSEPGQTAARFFAKTLQESPLAQLLVKILLPSETLGPGSLQSTLLLFTLSSRFLLELSFKLC